MTTLNLALVVFGGALLALNAFARRLQFAGFPIPLVALVFGVLVGEHGVGLLPLDDLGVEPHTLLEQAARLTLGVGLVGVALRLPHGYWQRRWRWVVAIIGVGMLVMWLVAGGLLWAGAGLPLVTALLIGAAITPTDPIATTPIVTGSAAERNIPDRVRYDLSSESGLNDGLAYLFVFLPILLMTSSTGEAWRTWLTSTLLWEVVGAGLLGAVAGLAIGGLFVVADRRGYMETTSYLGFVLPVGLVVLAAAKLVGTDGILAVFVAAAVFGQVIPQADEAREAQIDDVVSRLLIVPFFVLFGMGLPFGAWADLGTGALVTVAVAVFVRRLAAVWLVRPLFRGLLSRAETAFLGWFGPIGVSSVYYATVAERETGDHEVFAYITFAVAVSLVVHGLSTIPLGNWLRRTAPAESSR